MLEIGLGNIFKIVKNYFKIVGKRKKKQNGDDMIADMAQRKRSNITYYTSAFGIVQICQ